MSEIKFSADFDNSKLEAGIKQSNKLVAEFVKETEKAGVQIDNTFVNAGKSIESVAGNINQYGKAAVTTIGEQKKLIKSIEEDVKSLQKTFDKMASGKAKMGLGLELSSAKRALKEEYAELTRMQEKFLNDQRKLRFDDTHTKALVENAKRDKAEFSKIHQQALKENAEFDKANESFTEKIGKWALSLGGAAAGLAVLKKAFQETTGGMNLFNNVGAITNQVLYDIVSGAGLSIQKMSNALAIQKELNALRIKEYVDSYEAAKLNNQYQQLYSETLDASLTGVEKIKKIDEALEAHNKAIDIRVENVQENLRLVAASLIDKPGSEKLKKEYAALMTELENLDAERVSSTKRLVRQRSILIKEGTDEEVAFKKKIHDIIEDFIKAEEKLNEEQAKKLKEINNEIEQGKLKGMDKDLLALKQKYDADIEAYKDNAAIKKALTERYEQDKFEIELKYLEKLQKENEKFVESIQKINKGAGYAILDRTLTNAGEKPLSFNPVGNELRKPADSSRWAKEMQKAINDNDKERIKILNEESELRQRITGEVSNLVFQLGQASGLSDKQLSSLGSALDVFQSALSGGPAGWIGAATSLLSGLIELIPDEAAKFQRQIDQINRSLEEQQRLITLAERQGGKEEELQRTIDILEDARDATFSALASERGKLNQNKDRIQELTDLWEDYKIQIDKARQALEDFQAGGVTQNIIADTIAQGFQEGKTSIDDFADYMNDVLTDAVLNVFKAEILGPQIDNISKYIKEALSDKVLSSSEKAEIDRMVKEAADTNKQLWDGLAGSLTFGEDGPQPGLTGAISRQITEDTGTELAGLFRRFADDGRLTKDYTKAGVDHLIMIEKNTAATVDELKLAVTELKAINTNTKSQYAGTI